MTRPTSLPDVFMRNGQWFCACGTAPKLLTSRTKENYQRKCESSTFFLHIDHLITRSKVLRCRHHQSPYQQQCQFWIWNDEEPAWRAMYNEQNGYRGFGELAAPISYRAGGVQGGGLYYQEPLPPANLTYRASTYTQVEAGYAAPTATLAREKRSLPVRLLEHCRRRLRKFGLLPSPRLQQHQGQVL